MKKVIALGLLAVVLMVSSGSSSFAVDTRLALRPSGEKGRFENRRGHRISRGGHHRGGGWGFGFGYGPPPPPARPHYRPYARPYNYGPNYYYTPAPVYRCNPGVVVVPSPRYCYP